MHETDFSHEHIETAAERAAVARAIWDQDNIAFTTVGIDIGSSTSHLLFAKVLLQRQSQGLSSRFVVAAREMRLPASAERWIGPSPSARPRRWRC